MQIYRLCILDSTPRSQKIDKILANFFQSFISPQIIAAAPIGFLLLKALYLSFQMPLVRSRVGATCWGKSATPAARARLRRAFQISVELITEASLKKNFYMRFQWWQAVLLEWDSNVANSRSVIEKKRIFWNVLFLQFFTFFQLRFQWLGKKSILTQITIHTR